MTLVYNPCISVRVNIFWDHFYFLTKTVMNFVILFPKIEKSLNVAIQHNDLVFFKRDEMSDKIYVFRTESKQVMNLESFLFVCILAPNTHSSFFLINIVLPNTNNFYLESSAFERFFLIFMHWSKLNYILIMITDYF